MIDFQKKPIPKDTITEMIALLGHEEVKRKVEIVQPWLQLGQMETYPNPARDAPIRYQNYAIVADCFLVNRKALVSQLKENEKCTDQALLLAAYQRWGTNLVHYLEGLFAFSIWDEWEQLLFCAKDPVGYRPFYYAFRNHQFFFGSELKCILHSGLFRQLNETYFIDYLEGITGDKESTPFQNCYILPSGQCLTVRKSGLQKWTYWEPKPQPVLQLKRDEDYVEATEALLDQLMQEYIGESGKATGLLLNGCIESAFMLSHFKRISGDKPIFSVSYLLPDNYDGVCRDDRLFVELLQKEYPIDLKRVAESPFPNCFGEAIESKFWWRDTFAVNPIGSDHDVIFPPFSERGIQLVSGEVWYSLMSWTGNEYYRDLLMAGKLGKFFRTTFQQNTLNTARSIRWPIKKVLFSLLSYETFLFLRKCKRLTFEDPPPSLIRTDLALKIGLNERKKKLRITGKYPNLFFQSDLLRFIKLNLDSGKKPATTQQRLYRVTYLSPFQDRRLIDFLLSIPTEQFIGTPQRSSLMARLAERQGIPAGIIDRKDRTSWPPDWRDRRQNCKSSLFTAFDQIKKDDPIWEWADRKKAIHLFRMVKENGTYPFYRDRYPMMIRYPLISRYLSWLKDWPY